GDVADRLRSAREATGRQGIDDPSILARPRSPRTAGRSRLAGAEVRAWLAASRICSSASLRGAGGPGSPLKLTPRKPLGRRERRRNPWPWRRWPGEPDGLPRLEP